MTKEEKCKLAIERGYTYNPKTGKVYSRFCREITNEGARGYITFNLYFNNKYYSLKGHWFAWYCVYNECVENLDHINGIKHDNRILNLRSVTHQQNHFNRTTAKGYSWNKKANKWQSDICVNKKNIYLGLFNTEQEARNAYLAAKEKYHVI